MSETARRDSSGQVWLPNMKVWAKMPKRSAHASQGSFLTRKAGEAGDGTAVQPQQSGPASHQSLAAETDSDVECLEPDNAGSEDESGLPTCPICLGEILGRWDKAVVVSCMHIFCLACLSRWSALKRSCPLCKSRIEGYMYNIVSETKFNEQTFPPTPPREREPSPPIQARPASARAIIDERPAQRPFAQQGTAYRIDRPLVSSRAGDRRGVFRQSSNPQSNEWVHGVWPPRRTARQQQATSSSNSQQRSEPRPYFYRVQAQAQSQAQAAAKDKGDVIRSPQDAAEAWRRHVYVEGLYAQPMEGGPAVAVPPIMPEERKQHRLEAWVDRELRALLQTDDVAIVRAYVMGLVRGIGFANWQGNAEETGEQGGVSVRTDATAALKPFLHEHAAHFWHELRCFAAVSVSMQTYDRLAVYSPAQPGDVSASRPSSARASSSSERYLSTYRSEEAARPRSRESTQATAGHAQSLSASKAAHVRQKRSAEGQDRSDTRGKRSYTTRAESSQERKLHRASDSKRRRRFTSQPPAEPDDQSGSCPGHTQPVEKSKEAGNGVQCSSEPSQLYERRSREGGLDDHRSSKPSLGISVEGEPKRRHERQHRSGHNVLYQGSRPSHRSHAEAMTDRSGSAGNDVLAELRMRALASMKAHREHL